MNGFSQAQFYLDKALHTEGQESLRSYQDLVSFMARNAIAPKLLHVTQEALDNLGIVAAFEIIPPVLQEGFENLAKKYYLQADTYLSYVEIFTRKFNQCLPAEAKQSWAMTVDAVLKSAAAARDYARKGAAFQEVERIIEQHYPSLRNSLERPNPEQPEQWSITDLNRQLMKAGVSGFALRGDYESDLRRIRDAKESGMRDLPIFQTITAPIERPALIAGLAKNSMPPVASPYREMRAIAADVIGKTGHERLIALEELEQAARAAGIYITERCDIKGFRLPVHRIETVQTLASLELLGQELAQPCNHTAEGLAHLHRVAIALLDRPGLTGRLRNPLSELARDALDIFDDPRTVFAVAATEALTSGDNATASKLLKENGYEAWTIGHILTNDTAKANFLKRMESIGPVRRWNAVNQEIEKVRSRALQSRL